MPLIKEFGIGEGNVVLWRRDESSDDLLAKCKLTESESIYYKNLNTEKRRCEWLAWHLMVKKFFKDREVEISYTQAGAPSLNLDCELSVSHGGQLVGVVIAQRACGIDIEPLSRDFSRIKNRILNQPEIEQLTVLEHIAPAAAIGWCVKECAFKIARIEGVDFLNDIIITEANKANNSVRVEFSRFGTFEVTIKIIDNHIISYGINE